jgi:membrane protein implicated in regulation of membrane protease activity
MAWFSEWWQGLGFVGQIMAFAAIPMTVVMMMQLILMIIGVGSGGESSGGDIDGDGVDPSVDNPANEAGSCGTSSIFKIFTVRGIVAFFALGGWAGLAALTAGIPALWSIQIALISGVAALLLASIVIRFALRMQDSGNINLNNAVARTAEVYITIPPSRTNTGKVLMLLQERFIEIEAVTDDETAIRPNTTVEVVGLVSKDCLIVRPVKRGNNNA